jgi:hypothetical protein
MYWELIVLSLLSVAARCEDSHAPASAVNSAAAKISDKDRNHINFSCPDKRNIVSELHVLTKQSMQECVKRKWRYTRRSRETIIVSDLFSKVIRWIDLFKQVGDATA